MVKRSYTLVAIFVAITVSAMAVVYERLTVMSLMPEVADGPSPMPPPIPLERTFEITKLGNLRLCADRQGPESRPSLCYTRARIDGTLFWRALVGRKWADRPCYVSRLEGCAGGSIPVLL